MNRAACHLGQWLSPQRSYSRQSSVNGGGLRWKITSTLIHLWWGYCKWETAERAAHGVPIRNLLKYSALHS